MAQLQLPIRAFIEDFCTQAFPQLDWSRGSAVNDAVIKAFSAFMQPIRHEIDVIKVNQSVSNWQYMRQSDLDEIAANWAKFRQTGGLSIGTVRIIFSAANDYQFNSLQFYTSDGTAFVLSNPVSITAAQLFANKLSDGTFFFDVTVQSIGIGSRYALPAGSIVGVQNKPAGVVSVSNPNDFQVTAPDESNFDVVNSMYKNLGMKNLVSRQSIRAPLLDNFPGVIDIYIAGVGDPNMLRDLMTVNIPTGTILIHIGGMTDVWLNTTSVSQQQVLLNYLPSSLEIAIVSAAQAAADQLVFAFSRGMYSVDGIFANPDVASLTLDESSSIEFDESGVPLSTFVLGLVGSNRVQTGILDLLSGTEMLAIVGPAGYSPFVGDLTDLNIANTNVQADDYVLLNNQYYRIAQISGRLLDLAPTVLSVQDFLYAGAPLAAGSRSVALTSFDSVARINDRLILPDSAASGEYTVLGIASNLATIGKLVASGLATYIGVDPVNAGALIYHYTGPAGGQPLLPPNVGTTHYMYFGADGGYDQSKYFPVVYVTPGAAYTIFSIMDPSNLSPGYGTTVSIIQGLAGILPSNSLFTLQRDNGQPFAQAQMQNFATGHSKYANVVPVDVPAGTTTINSLGIGASCGVGDLIEFTGLNVPNQNLSSTGGDGSKVTVVITSITDLNDVAFQPPLPIDVPVGTPFFVVRNNVQIASAIATNVNNPTSDFTIASMPLGLGDALGIVLQDPSGNEYVVTASTAGNVRTLQFNAPSSVRTLTFTSSGYVPAASTDIGKPVRQVAGVTSNGTLYSFDNTALTWLVIPNSPSDTFADTSAVNISISGGFGAGQLSAAASSPAPVGYTNAVSGDLGQLVRQGTYTGVLANYDNTLYQWQVKPLSDSDVFDSTTALTFVDLGGGVPTSGHGQGTLFTAASAVVLGSGPVTITTTPAPTFSIGDTITFFSRFGRNAGFFDGTAFSVSSNPSINTTPFTGVVPGTQQLVILAGPNQGIYDINLVSTFSLFLAETLVPDYVELPNAPAAQPVVNASTLTQGTTTFAQTGIGTWGAPGRCILITGGGQTQVIPIASINNINSVQLENPGLAFPIYPNSSYTWQIVEALNIPYWIVNSAAVQPYRIFRIAEIGDLVSSSSAGGFTNVSPSSFTDLTTVFTTLFINADFSTGDYILYIDSGSQASSTPFVIQGVTGANTIQLAGATFPVTESNVAYRIQRVNAGRDKENWIEASVISMSNPKTELLLNVANGFDFERYGSHLSFDVTIVPHPSWTPPGGWSYGNNWTMAKFTASYNVSTKTLTLDNTTGHWTFTSGDAFTSPLGIALPAGSLVRVSLRMQDRSSAQQLDGSALETFNYYSNGNYFNLPVVNIKSVQVLDPTSLQPTRSVAFSLRVDDPGLRYSAQETNTLVIEDDTAALLPLVITYVTDSSIASVNSYLNQADTEITNANQLAKRMETIAIDITVSVQTTLTVNQVASQIASFINSQRSTQPLTKAAIIKDLFSSANISYVDLDSFVMTGTYYQQNGTITVFTDVNDIFGAPTATYLSNNISVTAL